MVTWRRGGLFALGLALATALLPYGRARAQTTITIATVNNGDMVVMQRLAPQFEQRNPNIRLRWVVLEENVLRQRVTTDIATRAGQFDILTIGNYEVPLWAKQKWLVALDNLPATFDLDDVLKPVRDGLSYEGKLYALPFYAESAMTLYRTDLFQKAGIPTVVCGPGHIAQAHQADEYVSLDQLAASERFLRALTTGPLSGHR